MGGVFISYRRDDASSNARAIYERLVSKLGGENVFIDLDKIPLGAKFPSLLADRLQSCEALIAIIGKPGCRIADTGNLRRIDNPEDYVRREISTGLARDIPVIPVLVNGAAMPSRNQLPDDLAPLADRQSIEMPDAYFDFAAERLVRALAELLSSPPKTAPPTPRASSPKIGRVFEKRNDGFGRQIIRAKPVVLASMIALLLAFAGITAYEFPRWRVNSETVFRVGQHGVMGASRNLRDAPGGELTQTVARMGSRVVILETRPPWVKVQLFQEGWPAGFVSSAAVYVEDVDKKTVILDQSVIPDGRLDIAQKVVDSFHQAGFGPIQQGTALAYAISASGLDPSAISGSCVGLFQICQSEAYACGRSASQLIDPETNIAIAVNQARTIPIFLNAEDVQDAATVFISLVMNEKRSDASKVSAIASRIVN